jgi:formate-dependent phosphoribosylglycinamide formyltransferase (GAR transformylase)
MVSTAIPILLAALTGVECLRLGLSVFDRRRTAPAVDRYVGHRLVLHLVDTAPSLRGVLVEAAPDALVLDRAEHVSETAVHALEGRQVVPRARVDFFQVLGSADALLPGSARAR